MKQNKRNEHQINLSGDVVTAKVLSKDYESLKSLVTSKENIEARNIEGHTPLGVALTTADFTAAHILLEGGANVTTIDKLGLTLMHIVIKMCDSYITAGYSQDDIFSIVKKLVERGASLNYQDRRGNTPINIIAQRAKPNKSAVAELYTRLGKLLLSLDKDVSNTIQLRNNMGKSPLDYLIKNGNFLLRDAVYEKLPHVQDRLNREMQQREWEVNKFISLDKQTKETVR